MDATHLTSWLDPNNYADLLGALALVVILSLVLERALSVFFEWGLWKDWLERKKLLAPLSYAAAYAVCAANHFDLFAIIFRKPEGWVSALDFGTFATAAVVAGGSKGAILLFQGVLGFGRDAVQAKIAARTQQAAGDSGG